jgi:cysteine-rich repeat protein
MKLSTSFFLAALAALTIASLSGCGEGNGEIVAGDPKAISMGDTVTCSLSGTDCRESCTILVGKSPEYVMSGGERSVEFTVLGNVADKAEIVCHCGDGPMELITSKCTVQSGTVPETGDLPSDNEDMTVPVADEDGEDAVITPLAPSAPEPAPELPPAPEASSEPETPQPPADLQVSLTVTKMFDTKPGLVKINYSRTGGGSVKQFYIYGGFSEDGNCDGLVVDPSGVPLNQGSKNYLKYQSLLTGTACKEADANCHDYTSTMIVYCRIELSGNTGDFYAMMHQEVPSYKYVLIGQAEDGTFKKSEKTVLAPTPNPCGNGNLDEGEKCEDGNRESNDGCDDHCRIEPGWYCQAMFDVVDGQTVRRYSHCQSKPFDPW